MKHHYVSAILLYLYNTILEPIKIQLKYKGKAVPQYIYGGTGVRGGIFSSYSFTTSALDGGE
jgi:hypothetical protein